MQISFTFLILQVGTRTVHLSGKELPRKRAQKIPISSPDGVGVCRLVTTIRRSPPPFLLSALLLLLHFRLFARPLRRQRPGASPSALLLASTSLCRAVGFWFDKAAAIHPTTSANWPASVAAHFFFLHYLKTNTYTLNHDIQTITQWCCVNERRKKKISITFRVAKHHTGKKLQQEN